MTATKHTILLGAATLLSTVFLMSCSKSVPVNQAEEHAHSHSAPSEGKKSDVAPGYIKPGPGVMLVGETNFALNPNDNTEISVRFSTKSKQGTVKIKALAETGFTLGKSEWALTIGAEDLAIDIPVQTGSAGAYYLMFEMELTGESGAGKRVQGVKLMVGEQAPVLEKTTTGGVKAMEAEEKIY